MWYNSPKWLLYLTFVQIEMQEIEGKAPCGSSVFLEESQIHGLDTTFFCLKSK